jgi:hypothetical protein
MRIIGDVGRFGDKVTSVFGNMASEIAGKQVFNPTSAHSIVVEALEKKRSSEALAKRLWMSFVVEGRDALYPEDIREVLGPARQEEADEAFAAVDQDGNGDISLEEMIMKVVEIGIDRKSIASSMNDIGQAIAVFDQVLATIAFLIMIFVFGKFPVCNTLSNLLYSGSAELTLTVSGIPKSKFYHHFNYGRNHPTVSIIHLRCYCTRVSRIMHLSVREASL